MRTLIFSTAILPFFASAATMVTCPPDTATGGDSLVRSFYLPAHSRSTLDTVTVNYHSSVNGSYTVALEARLNAFDGTLIGPSNGLAPSPPGRLAALP
ncbi:hypothetical protein ACFX58_03895 [Sphingomonas sp. NCPPB 2930]